VLLGRWNWWPSRLHIDEPAPVGDAPLGETAPVAGDAR